MLPPKKYIKKATKQGVITTILLGVIPFSFALGLDIFAVVNNQGHELINFNNMMSSLLPTNHTYINILVWLSDIYTIPLFFIVIIDKNFKRKIMIPNWLKNFILNFEPALSTVFSFMFIASSTFFTLFFPILKPAFKIKATTTGVKPFKADCREGTLLK